MSGKGGHVAMYGLDQAGGSGSCEGPKSKWKDQTVENQGIQGISLHCLSMGESSPI